MANGDSMLLRSHKLQYISWGQAERESNLTWESLPLQFNLYADHFDSLFFIWNV